MLTRIAIVDVVLLAAIGAVASTLIAQAERSGETPRVTGQVLGVAAVAGLCCCAFGLAFYPALVGWLSDDADIAGPLGVSVFWFALAAPFRFFSSTAAFVLHALADGPRVVRWRLIEAMATIAGNVLLMNIMGWGFAWCFVSGSIVAILSSLYCWRVLARRWPSRRMVLGRHGVRAAEAPRSFDIGAVENRYQHPRNPNEWDKFEDIPLNRALLSVCGCGPEVKVDGREIAALAPARSWTSLDIDVRRGARRRRPCGGDPLTRAGFRLDRTSQGDRIFVEPDREWRLHQASYAAIARETAVLSAQHVSRLETHRRLTTLVVFAREIEAILTDAALAKFSKMLRSVFRPSTGH